MHDYNSCLKIHLTYLINLIITVSKNFAIFQKNLKILLIFLNFFVISVLFVCTKNSLFKNSW
jgi:hypothetical protein